MASVLIFALIVQVTTAVIVIKGIMILQGMNRKHLEKATRTVVVTVVCFYFAGYRVLCGSGEELMTILMTLQEDLLSFAQ